MKVRALHGVWWWLPAVALWAAGTTPPQALTEFTAAGCFIATPYGVVLNITRGLGRIQMPMGGREPGETALQTARRETREETGLEVEIGVLLMKWDDDRVLLFQCTPMAPIDYPALRPIDTLEVAEVLVMNPHTLLNFDGRTIDNPWRFANTRALLRALVPR